VAPRCTICDHPKRREIDKALATKRGSMRQIAQRFAVSPHALTRHRAHLSRQLTNRATATEETNADQLLRELYESKAKVLRAMEEIEMLTNGNKLVALPALLACVKTHCTVSELLLKVEIARAEQLRNAPRETETAQLTPAVQRVIDAVVTNDE